MYGRKQPNIVKQLSSNKIKKKNVIRNKVLEEKWLHQLQRSIKAFIEEVKNRDGP